MRIAHTSVFGSISSRSTVQDSLWCSTTVLSIDVFLTSILMANTDIAGPSETRRLVNNINCCVQRCTNTKGKKPNLSFHQFPNKNQNTVYITNRLGVREKIDRHQAWKVRLNMQKPVTRFMKVCSRHFVRDDFILPGRTSKKPRLKKFAVPSRNLPIIMFKGHNKPMQAPTQEVSFIKPKPIEELLEPLPPEIVFCDVGHLESVETEVDQQPVEAIPEAPPSPETKDQGTQVKSGDLLFSLLDNVKTDAQLYTLTGIANFELFDRIVADCQKVSGGFSRRLSLKECVLLTFMKLKNGFTYSVLAVLFQNITGTTCAKVFHETLVILTRTLSAAIQWASSEVIPADTPEHHEPHVVVGMTEVEMETPRGGTVNCDTYSKFRKKHLLKFLIVVTPGAKISFVSKGYGGKYNDVEMLGMSGLMKKLEGYKDKVPVKICFSTKRGSALQRVIQRIHNFDIVRKPLSVTLRSRIDDIVTVLCGVVNLTHQMEELGKKDEKESCFYS